jgi:N6-L-threonylcarbamoyladenine synthase
VNHLIGHLLSAYLHREDQATPHRAPVMPFVALVASGGHTALYEVRSATDIEQLGQTRDDAAGECFDKVAKLLGLGYPGGPRIDKLAAQGTPGGVKLPRPLRRPGNLEFSFSGLKTAVAHHVEQHGLPEGEQAMADLCASFQAVVTEALVEKCLAACELRSVPRLVITGGVAANRGLRTHAERRCAEAGVELFVPPPSSCTDNGAMIAYAGACRLLAGADDGLSFEVYSRSPVLGAHLGSPALARYRSSKLPRAGRG